MCISMKHSSFLADTLNVRDFLKVEVKYIKFYMNFTSLTWQLASVFCTDEVINVQKSFKTKAGGMSSSFRSMLFLGLP